MIDKSSASVQTMFDDISGTYDLLNHVLSGNQDVRWRRRAISLLCPRRGERILDLCCGTGDLTREIKRQQPFCEVVGADFSLGMLQIAATKSIPNLVNADALHLPFSDESFEGVSVAYGVRNFEDTKRGLEEIYRALKPNGRLMVLEFMRATSPIVQKGFGAFKVVLAPLARQISGHGSAYNYLPQSIGGFYTRREFEELLKEVGFQNVRSFDYSLGISTAFIAQKSA
jgi:demethylmenaquinone methyltransferase/2-methoxy-6-polyprenyl-1,4-benzoquinol methylase